MRLLESAEMYLETIYLLSFNNGAPRSIDVAEHMGFSKPSVSRAVSNLKKNGYLEVSESGILVLTESGKEAARKVYERHNVLTRLFVKLGVSDQIAAEDACRVEHVISDQTFEAICKFTEK